MGLFSEIGKSIGFLGDIAGGFISTSRQKRGIDEAVAAETGQAQTSLSEADLLRERNLARTDPFLGAGTRATTTLEDLISGEGRLAPTSAERFATERAFEGIDRASAANKRVFSGRRIEEFGEAAADIGSRFRNIDIGVLQNLAGRGLSAAQIAQGGDIGVTSEQNRLRELIGNVSSAGILGKTAADVGNIANVTSNFAKLNRSGGNLGDFFAGGG